MAASESSPLRLYVNRGLMVPEISHINLLFPFFGPIFKETTPYVNAVYRQHMADGRFFSLVDDITIADYVCVPHPYIRLKQKKPDVLETMLKEAHDAGKPLLIDACGDLEVPIDIPNAVILRMGQYRLQKRPNEITVPIDVEDLGETHYGGRPPLREKTEIASIGFSGWAYLAPSDRIKAFVRFFPFLVRSLFDSRYGAFEKGVLIRERALHTLARSKRVRTNLLVRRSYSGNTTTLQGDAKANREAFVQNLVDSDYALSVKGDGNVDMRLYEAMSLGRIPVIVDTERVLPLEDEIHYREFCLIVDFRRMGSLDRALADFHASLSADEFLKKQHRAREVFEQYLRPDAFTRHLASRLRERLAQAA